MASAQGMAFAISWSTLPAGGALVQLESARPYVEGLREQGPRAASTVASQRTP